MSWREIRCERRSSVSASGPRSERTLLMRLSGYPSLLAYLAKDSGSGVGSASGRVGKIEGMVVVVIKGVKDSVTVAVVRTVVSSRRDSLEKVDSIV